MQSFKNFKLRAEHPSLPPHNYFPSQFHIPWKVVNIRQQSQLFILWFNTRVISGRSLCHPQAQADYICKASDTCGHVPRVNSGSPFLTFALVAARPTPMKAHVQCVS